MGEIRKLSAEELAALREKIRNESQNIIAEQQKSEEAAQAYYSMSNKGKNISIDMSQDHMSATVTLSDPEDEEYTIPEIVVALRSKKIVIGIDTQALTRLVTQKIYDEPIVVANGKPMVPSVDGYYEYFFDTNEHRTPEIREDGSADYSAVGRLANVEENQLIAIYHPATTGENGYDITGHEKVPKPAKEKPALRGQYIYFKEETNEYFAKRAGKISVNDSNVEILDVHEINGNVTLVQGKVEFYGDLYIHGDVESGTTIRAGRNVVIDGSVGAATIFAGGDIILQKGIHGANKGKVSARGNIFSDFIEYASIEAGMDVYANSIINSNITTRGTVVVSGTYGSIIGGDTNGLRGIITNAAGNESEIRTTLHAGFFEQDYEKYQELTAKEKRITASLEEVVDDITLLFKASAKAQKITQSQKSQILLLNEKKVELQNQIDQIKEDKADISRKMALGMGAFIEVRGNIFRNVIIKIDTASHFILKNDSFVRFTCKNETIEKKYIAV